MTVDAQRGIVYVPTGSAAVRFLRWRPHWRRSLRQFADRAQRRDRRTHLAFSGRPARHLGSRFSVRSGSRHRQARWQVDVDAVAQTSKQGFVFLFDRATGKPLFPIEYRKYPASTVPGEVTAAEQPLPTKACALRAPASHRRYADQPHSRSAPVGAANASDTAERRPVRSVRRRQRHRDLSGLRRRRRMGWPCASTRTRPSSMSTPTRWPGSPRWGKTRATILRKRSTSTNAPFATATSSRVLLRRHHRWSRLARVCHRTQIAPDDQEWKGAHARLFQFVRRAT